MGGAFVGGVLATFLIGLVVSMIIVLLGRKAKNLGALYANATAVGVILCWVQVMSSPSSWLVVTAATLLLALVMFLDFKRTKNKRAS